MRRRGAGEVRVEHREVAGGFVDVRTPTIGISSVARRRELLSAETSARGHSVLALQLGYAPLRPRLTLLELRAELRRVVINVIRRAKLGWGDGRRGGSYRHGARCAGGGDDRRAVRA